jgi:hypothetical protein
MPAQQADNPESILTAFTAAGFGRDQGQEECCAYRNNGSLDNWIEYGSCKAIKRPEARDGLSSAQPRRFCSDL